MKILKIQRNKIYLDTEEIIDVNKDLINKFNLKEEINIESIYIDIIYESMKIKALYLIYLKERTAYQLKLKLREKYISKNYYLIDNLIEEFIQLGYIDDMYYACGYIRVNKEVGTNKLKFKLKEKGISENIILEALEEVNSEINLEEIEVKNIRKFIEKNYNIDKNKMINKLLNRGYRFDLIIKEIKAKQ